MGGGSQLCVQQSEKRAEDSEDQDLRQGLASGVLDKSIIDSSSRPIRGGDAKQTKAGVCGAGSPSGRDRKGTWDWLRYEAEALSQVA